MNTPLDSELVQALKKLKLGKLAATLPDRLVLAEKQQMAREDFLLLLLHDEISRREGNAVAMRVDRAGLDPQMRLERWDASAKVTYDKRLLAELTTLRFIEQRRHVVILGSVGVGKTFLANALGHLACQQLLDVRFVRVDDLLRTLRQSRLDNSRDAVLAELIGADLLILDDFGLDTMTKDESRDVYQLFVERTGMAATVVTSNRDTSEWLAVFDESLRAQSAVDRFKNNAYDLIIDGESYRARLKPALDGPPPAPAPPRRRRR
jgi:DNA replication protein DnaC